MTTIEGNTSNQPAAEKELVRVKVLFFISGEIREFPRIVSSLRPGEVKTLDSFELRFHDSLLVYKDDPTDLSQALQDQAHNNVKKAFSTGCYTDSFGVIKELDPPANKPWWVAISDIKYTVEFPPDTNAAEKEAPAEPLKVTADQVSKPRQHRSPRRSSEELDAAVGVVKVNA
jgi:hypothetical protein